MRLQPSTGLLLCLGVLSAFVLPSASAGPLALFNGTSYISEKPVRNVCLVYYQVGFVAQTRGMVFWPNRRFEHRLTHRLPAMLPDLRLLSPVTTRTP